MHRTLVALCLTGMLSTLACGGGDGAPGGQAISSLSPAGQAQVEGIVYSLLLGQFAPTASMSATQVSDCSDGGTMKIIFPDDPDPELAELRIVYEACDMGFVLIDGATEILSGEDYTRISYEALFVSVPSRPDEIFSLDGFLELRDQTDFELDLRVTIPEGTMRMYALLTINDDGSLDGILTVESEGTTLAECVFDQFDGTQADVGASCTF